MTTLLLVRHGESEANLLEVLAGFSDYDLTEKGFDQAKLTAQFIAHHYKVDRIYSSDLIRAYRTAGCLADILDFEVVKDKDLREIFVGEWEGMKFVDCMKNYAQAYDAWLNHYGHVECPGGETVKQHRDRVMGALTKIAEENSGRTVAIMTHGGAIRVAQCMIQTGALGEMEHIPWVSNASITVLEFVDGVWSIAAVGLDHHLGKLRTVLPDTV